MKKPHARPNAEIKPDRPEPTAAVKPELPWHGTIERLAWGGHGVGRLDDGRILLLRAPLALFPGEEVDAAVQLKARHGEGHVTGWTRSDSRRVEPACPYAMHCGGCDFWGAGAHTPELKFQLVTDLMHRSLPAAVPWEWLAAPAGAKRSRIQLHWDGTHLGYHQRDSNNIVPVAECPMADAALSRTIPLLHAALAAGTLPAEPMRWELVAGTPPRLIVALQAPAGTPLANPAWAAWEPGSDTQDNFTTGRGKPPVLEHVLAAGTLCHSASSFFQVSPAWAAQALAQLYSQWQITGATLYDLYGGVGFHSALLASAFQHLVVIEADALACYCARQNLAAYRHRAESMLVERWLSDPAKRAGFTPEDVLLLDPPRAGLPKQVVAALCGIRAGTLVLCGCDGASFCRDVARLAPAWQLQRLAVLDLFANTVHVECVGLLRRVLP